MEKPHLTGKPFQQRSCAQYARSSGNYTYLLRTGRANPFFTKTRPACVLWRTVLYCFYGKKSPQRFSAARDIFLPPFFWERERSLCIM